MVVGGDESELIDSDLRVASNGERGREQSPPVGQVVPIDGVAGLNATLTNTRTGC